ncbi:MAG: hypothetical protein WD155_05765, partial [Burkholderiales bacterium]
VRIKDAARLRLETLTLWDGRALPEDLRSELEREIQRLGLVERQTYLQPPACFTSASSAS